MHRPAFDRSGSNDPDADRGYVFAIRSERRLCSEVQVNLAYRWFCKLSVEDQISVLGRCQPDQGVDKKRRVPGDQPTSWPKAEETSRAVREYIAALDAARNNEERGDGGGGSSDSGGSRSKPPKEVSLTDPQATWVTRPGVNPFFAYDANYLIDNKAGIIIDAEGTRANRTVEVAIAQTMMERVGRRFGLRPQRFAGDTVYGAVRLLKWLVDRKITPHVPVWDKSARHDGTSAEPTLSSTRNAMSTLAREAPS